MWDDIGELLFEKIYSKWHVVSAANSLLLSDAIWRHRSGKTLTQIMTCCLTAPNHYLNQCWLVMSEALGLHTGAISQETMISIFVMSFKMYKLLLQPHFQGASQLTHWGRVKHICVSKLTTISSYNGLSPGRRQAIIWTNDGILLIWQLETKFNEILVKIHKLLFKRIHINMSSGNWRPFCFGLNVLTNRVHSVLGYNIKAETSE